MEDKLTKFYRTIVKSGFYPSQRNLKFWLHNLFKDIDLQNKNILDIGGGVGVISLYAACSGARNVICLEPELAGSSKNLQNKFNILKQELIVYNVNFVSESFQNFNSDELFDVVISNASINHLNEDACIKLRESKIAKEEYRNIFRKLSKMTISGSKLIICDCSNKNFFNLIGLKNPFVPTIEWEKHQSPEVWAKLLEECGFRKEKIRWSSPNKLGKFGNLIVGNKFFSYFLSSHFCLWMERV